MTRANAGDVLLVKTPRLPRIEVLRNVTHSVPAPTLETRLFLENCADRLTVLGDDGAPRLAALDAVTMSLDGLTYRLTLKKGLFFHCGAEVTANDAVETVRQIARLSHSASQLHRYVARDKEGRHDASVYPVSRYRFEIHLARRLPDLLARLAIPELALRHDGKACFSGLWWPKSGGTEDRLELSLHTKHVDAPKSQYKHVVWERLVDGPTFETGLGRDPCLLIYPGTQFKSPPEELLADEICRPLLAGLSYLIKIEGDHTSTTAGEVRARLAHAARLAYEKTTLWHRQPLHALLPKGHALHTTFFPEPPPTGGKRLTVRLTTTDEHGALPPPVFAELAKAAATLDLAVTLEEGSGAQAHGHLKAVFHDHPTDAYTPLSFFSAESRDLASAWDEERGGKIPRACLDFCQAVAKAGALAPVLSVPFVVRCNRTIRGRDTTGLVHFADIRQSEDRLRKARLEEATLKALGAALQMFVHDVKRPFSMVQGLLSLLDAAAGPGRVQELATRFLPDIQRSVAGVDRMIQDILEIGSDAELNLEPLVVGDVVQGVLEDVFNVTAFPDLQLDYRWDHKRRPNGDHAKLQRAVGNLVTNAAEAMAGRGVITFSTEEDATDGTLLMTVHNTGTFIPETQRAGLFDRFFTEGKKRGTGLGLAIVKKIVADHGGEVWCESDEKTGTSFRMTLPLATEKDPGPSTPLPRRAADVRTKTSGLKAARDSETKDLGRIHDMDVLLVDDSPLYLEMIQALMSEDERRRCEVRFATASAVDQALRLATTFKVAVVDVDLGDGPDGLSLVKELRAKNPALKICVHSNGAPFELQKRVIEAGGDLFLPKPMARDHLLRLLASAAGEAAAKRPRIAVVDDDGLILETWESLPGYEWLTFASPKALLEAAERDPTLLSSLRCVVTDYVFERNADTGSMLAAKLVVLLPTLPVFLATDHPAPVDRGVASTLPRLPKDAVKALAMLEAMLRSATMTVKS